MRQEGVIPDWLENGVDSSLRDTEDDAPPLPPVPLALSSAQQKKKGVMSPIVLTPTGGSPPGGSGLRNGSSKGPWTDLDKFYDDDNNEDKQDDDEEDEEEDSEEEADESEEDDGGQRRTRSEDDSESGSADDIESDNGSSKGLIKPPVSEHN